MTSAAYKSAGTGRHAEGRGFGLVWSLTIIAADIVALWGLCAYGSRENIGAAA